MKIDILLLEDDELFAESLEDFLEECGFSVTLAKDGQEANILSYERSFDLLLLDVNVPKIDGFTLLKELRGRINTPAIYITSFKDKSSVKKGFLSGGDDFLSKPVDLEELQLRIEALLRRSKSFQEQIVIRGKIYERERALLDGVKLNKKCKKLLDLLLEYPDEIVSKELIYERVWEWNESVSEASLRVYINTLKKTLGKDAITNHKGIGYRLEF